VSLLFLLEDIVLANRILVDHGIVDSFGHVSVRHPDDPRRYLMSRARAPECIELDDIMEFALDGTPLDPRGRKPYLERYIHGAVYERRPDVGSVVHSHSHAVIPFGVAGTTLRPVMHACAEIGAAVPIWEPRETFGDTDMLVSGREQGLDLAAALGDGHTILMRGHGSVAAGRSLREAVYTAIALQTNAALQSEAQHMTDRVNFLSAGEIARIVARHQGAKAAEGYDRAWEGWCKRIGAPFKRDPATVSA
jgi:HCOMODA/2-hydroxy-3-carboxy-muconic semialdehyde decarboxylase